MNSEILMISPEKVKNITNINDNINGKLLECAIREACDEGLQCILGQKLYEKLQELIENNTIKLPINEIYKDILDKAQYYLAYTVAQDITLMTYAKIDNAGVRTIKDEHSDTVDWGDAVVIADIYQKKADFYCRRLQDFLWRNRNDYRPYLQDNTIRQIKSNLYSSASSGIWLGGPRGKGRYYTRYADYYKYNG